MKKRIWIPALAGVLLALTIAVAAPLNGGDPNCDDANDVADLSYMVDFLWRGGPSPCEIPAQQTWQPVAAGVITSDGEISNGTGNFTCTCSSGGIYTIAIDSVNYYFSDYVTLVTPVSGDPVMARTSSGAGKLNIYLYDTSGAFAQRMFNFVTYKL